MTNGCERVQSKNTPVITVLRGYYERGRRMANRRLAERGGFEPPIGLRLCRISSAVLSTAQPPVRTRFFGFGFSKAPKRASKNEKPLRLGSPSIHPHARQQAVKRSGRLVFLGDGVGMDRHCDGSLALAYLRDTGRIRPR